MSDITFSMSADEKEVTKALQNTTKEFGKVRDAIANMATASKEAGTVENQIAQQRMAALNPLVAKQKELRAALEESTKQLKDGKITADQHAAAVKSNAEASDQLTQKLKELQVQIAEDTNDFRKAATVIGQVEDKTEKYARAVAELDRYKAKGIITSKQHAAALDAEKKKLEDVGGGADKSGGLISGLTQKMSGFVAGLAGSVGIVQTLRAEYQNLLEVQGKSAQAHLTLAPLQEELVNNLGGADAKGVFKTIEQLSTERKISQEVLTQAVTASLSARGDMGVDAVAGAVGSASKIKRLGSAQELSTLASGILDTQKATGLGTDQALGYLQQLQSVSRTKSLTDLSQNFTPAVGGVMKLGTDRATAGALLASLSQGMGDATGAVSATAGLSLASQLREFAPGQDISKTIGQLQQNDQMRGAFLKNASFEVKAAPHIEELLSGRGKMSSDFASFQKTLQGDPTAMLNQTIADRAAAGSIAFGERNQGLQTINNQMALNDRQGAMASIFRNNLSEMKKRTHGSTFAMIDDMVEDFNGQDTGRAIQKLGLIRNRAFVENTRQMDADGVRTADEIAARMETDKMFSRMVGELERLNATQQQALSTQKQTVHAGAAVGRRDRQGENAP